MPAIPAPVVILKDLPERGWLVLNRKFFLVSINNEFGKFQDFGVGVGKATLVWASNFIACNYKVRPNILGGYEYR